MTAEPSQPDFEALYHRAFADFKLRALWNVRKLEHPTAEEALIITRSLRVEGDLNARRLAEQIERACRAAPRFSGGIHVFHDRQKRVTPAALNDDTAGVTKDDDGTRLEWVVDSDYRFFPTMPDEIFGYVLHPVDLAMNKVMAAAGRRELRDLVDLVTVHETILPLGPVIWAAVEKSDGFTPEGLIAEIRRNSHYPTTEWLKLISSEPIEPKDITSRLRTALEEAEAFVLKMPTDKAGLLFLKDGHLVQPDPASLGEYQPHAGQRRGHWPTSAAISAAMFERYTKPPAP